MDKVVEELLEVLGAAAVTVGEAVPRRYWNDWAGLEPRPPKALIRPATTGELSACLRICNAHRQAVVPQGGRTGLAGGARPEREAIALSLERLAGIEEIDPATATMTVRAGTVLEAAQTAAEEAGFLLPLDLGARGSCQIGGNLATNAGGNRVVRFGMARDMVLGLEVVLADGTILSNLNKLLKNNAGFDLKQLFIGSEGVLGIISRAVLRLQPRPRSRAVAFCGLRDFPAVIELLKRARTDLGGRLSAFEAMWPGFYELLTGHVAQLRAPLSGRHGIYLLLEAQGYDPARDPEGFEQLLEGMFEAGLVEDAALARSEADIRGLWAVRDAVAEFPRIFGRHLNFDIGLAIDRMEAYVRACASRLAERFPGIRAVFFGHVADGNIHVVTDVPAGVEPAAIEQEVYGLVRRFGGTVSAEHGIGTIKKPYLGYVRSPEEIALMRRLKRSLDPRGILNPGKVIDP